jgi:hypothetical protein
LLRAALLLPGIRRSRLLGQGVRGVGELYFWGGTDKVGEGNTGNSWMKSGNRERFQSPNCTASHCTALYLYCIVLVLVLYCSCTVLYLYCTMLCCGCQWVARCKEKHAPLRAKGTPYEVGPKQAIPLFSFNTLTHDFVSI